MRTLGGALSVPEWSCMAKGATGLAPCMVSLLRFLKAVFSCVMPGLCPALCCSMGVLVRRGLVPLSLSHMMGLVVVAELVGGSKLSASLGGRA